MSNHIRSHILRLSPHQDLKTELLRIAQAQEIRAASLVSAVGSLQKVTLRLAGQTSPTVFEGFHEIVSVTGTLSKESLHIHLAAANSKGEVIGGHLMDGNPIHTTCELVLLEYPQVEFERKFDPQTGYRELSIKPLP